MPVHWLRTKKYTFACLLPLHEKGEYWTDVETGIHNAVETYSDFNVAVHLSYYDPYDYHSFAEASGQILSLEPDGVMFAPHRSTIHQALYG